MIKLFGFLPEIHFVKRHRRLGDRAHEPGIQKYYTLRIPYLGDHHLPKGKRHSCPSPACKILIPNNTYSLLL